MAKSVEPKRAQRRSSVHGRVFIVPNGSGDIAVVINATMRMVAVKGPLPTEIPQRRQALHDKGGWTVHHSLFYREFGDGWCRLYGKAVYVAWKFLDEAPVSSRQRGSMPPPAPVPPSSPQRSVEIVLLRSGERPRLTSDIDREIERLP